MHKKLRKITSDWASPRKEKGSCREQRKQCQLSVGCWNMRTLVESEGKYGVSATGISETKWFGQAFYQVEGYTILHSG